jgi:hypothetical protein
VNNCLQHHGDQSGTDTRKRSEDHDELRPANARSQGLDDRLIDFF